MISTSINNLSLFNNQSNRTKVFYRHNKGIYNYVYSPLKEVLSFIDDQNRLYIRKSESLIDVTKCMDVDNILGGIGFVDESN
jgi:hypothetical protein